MRRGPIRSLPLCITALAVVMIVVMTSPGAGDGPDLPPGGDGDPDPRALWAAAEVTRASASARVELRTTVAGPSGPVTLVHRGAFTDGGVRARAESDMSEVAAPASVADNDTLALALDPLGPLDLLRRPVVEMGVVGAEEVRGTPTR